MRAFVFPGQGSQRKGMGSELFPRFAAHCQTADRVLGFSITGLCLDDSEGRLKLTQYVQPALFVVNALSWLARAETPGGEPDFFAGHSLGEYDALFAAGCMDFETGLTLVKRRGELMGKVTGGGMVAVIGLTLDRLAAVLADAEVADVDIANHNARTQIVLSGPLTSLERAKSAIAKERGVRCVPLKMSAASHSRYMEPAATAFGEFLKDFRFSPPRVPVLANVTAAPVQSAEEIPGLLIKQICGRVRWWETMKHLRAAGVRDVEELGPGHVLADLWSTTESESGSPAPKIRPMPAEPAMAPQLAASPSKLAPARSVQRLGIAPELLGCAEFRRDHGVRLAYAAGAMFRAIASVELVIRMARSGLLAFYGAGGMSQQELDAALQRFKSTLPPGSPWGMNLLHAYGDPAKELATVDLYLQHDVRTVEAAAFVQVTAPLVLFRFRGAHRGALGQPLATRRVIAKVSRPEVARAFMEPAPEALVRALVAQERLTSAEAEIALLLPISEDVCVEADSGGHTDARHMNTLLPAIVQLRDEVMRQRRYPTPIRVGAAGGIGTPESVASALVLGADFVMGGSIHQCSPEAGTSDTVKDLLADLGVHDTTYAPAGDMFEAGARVQVVRKGTLFPGRANRLLELYRQYPSLDALDARTRQSLEQFYYKRSLNEVWRDTAEYFVRGGQANEVDKAERDPRHKMALVFRCYFAESIQAALHGDVREKANYQIHCGPAMGAFNGFAKDTSLSDWRNRHVDVMADELMTRAAARIDELLRRFGSVHELQPRRMTVGGEDGIRTHL